MEYNNHNLVPHAFSILRDVDAEERLIDKLRENHLFLVDYLRDACEDRTWSEQHPKLLERVSLLALEQAKEGSLALEDARRISQYVLAANFRQDQAISALSPLLDKAFLSSRNDHQTSGLTEIEISQFLLNACGTFFRKALNSSFKESSGHIALDFSRTQLAKLKELIENGSLPDLEQLSDEEKNKFISGCLLIGENIPKITRWISQHLNEDNVLFTLHHAYAFNLSDLIQNCFDYFNSNFEKIRFKALSSKEVQLELNKELAEEDLKDLQPIFVYFLLTEKDFALKTRFPNTSFIGLTQMCRVTALNLSDSQIDDQLLIKLVNECPNLSSINLTWCENITNDAIVQLAEKRPSLSSINLAYCKSITNETIIKLAEKCPNLSSIDLAFCTITNDAIIRLAEKLPKLSSIDLACCQNITNDAIIQFTRKCPSLSSINLFGCKNITDDVIIQLADRGLNLSSINLDSCQMITDKAIIQLAEKCQNLSLINLQDCTSITDDAIIRLAEKLPNLSSIDLSGCQNITDKAIIQLAEKCPRLSSIYSFSCSKISDTVFKQLKEKYPKLNLLKSNHGM